MTLDPPLAASVAAWVAPGYCADHPNQRLVTHRAAGLRSYGTRNEVVCPDPAHGYTDRERCRWCGGPLVDPAETTRRSPRRAYCSPLHRLHAFRSKQRR